MHLGTFGDQIVRPASCTEFQERSYFEMTVGAGVSSYLYQAKKSVIFYTEIFSPASLRSDKHLVAVAAARELLQWEHTAECKPGTVSRKDKIRPHLLQNNSKIPINTHNLFWYIPEVMSPQELFSSCLQKPLGRKAYGRHVGRTRPDGYEEAEGTHLENQV